MKLGRPIRNQDDFVSDFKGTVMAGANLDEIIDLVQYKMCGENFSVSGCYTVRGKKREPRLQVVIDHENGYVKKSITLGDNFCSQKCYGEIWKRFATLRLQPVEDDLQAVITLENAENNTVKNPVEAF